MKIKKRQLHDLLAEEFLEKSNGIDAGVPDSTLPLNDIVVQSELTNGSNFIEEKETERGHISRLQMPTNNATIPCCNAVGQSDHETILTVDICYAYWL